MADSLFKKPQGFLDIGTSSFAWSLSAFGMVPFHVSKVEAHGTCEGWSLSASQFMADMLMVIHSTGWKHALSHVPNYKMEAVLWHKLDW